MRQDTMNKPRNYTKRPVTIQAMQWDGTAADATDIIEWAANYDANIGYSCNPLEGEVCTSDTQHRLSIQTREGIIYADSGYFILKGVEDEFYPCDPGIFLKTYTEGTP